jgi:hypothetical protein
MIAVSTGSPILGCESEWEELALAFCTGSVREAADLVRYMQLKQRGEELRARIPAAEQAITRSTQALVAARAEVDASKGIQFTAPLMIMGLSLVGVGIAGWAFATSVSQGGIGCMLGLVALVGGVMIAIQVMADRRQRRGAIAKLAGCEAALAEADAGLRQLQASLASLREQALTIKPRKSVRSVGRVYFPSQVVEINGKTVALDQSGVMPVKQMRLADFDFDASELAQLVDRIESLREIPVLLDPGDARPSAAAADELYGEERDLRETVETFAEFVGRIPTTQVQLPVVPRGRPIVAEIGASPVPSPQFPGATITDGKDADRSKAVAKLKATLGSSRARGSGPKLQLLDAHSAIAKLLSQYRDLRSSSIGAIHAQMLAAMSRSSWCTVRFYCPKSTRNPAWTLRRLGIDTETAHDAPQAEVLDRLSADPDIAARIAEKPDLVIALDRAWRGLNHARTDLEHCRGLARGAATTVGAVQGGPPASLSAFIRGLESQERAFIEEYRICLNKVIFGQRQPLVEFTSVPRLTYDPETGAWSNEAAGTEYRDQEDVDCSRVLRVHEELLHPMWRHLWGEKADLRRTELFRTNQQMLEMNEKESEKLISIGNQFRDDMRATREVLKQVYGELEGKMEQMRGTRDALQKLALLSPDEAAKMEQEWAALAAGIGGNFLQRAEERETLLATEPQAQAERRELVTDPIDLIAMPKSLFAEHPAHAFRRRLLGHAAQEHDDAPAARVVVQGADGT